MIIVFFVKQKNKNTFTPKQKECASVSSISWDHYNCFKIQYRLLPLVFYLKSKTFS